MQPFSNWGYSPPTRGLKNPFLKVHGPRKADEVPGWILGHFPWEGQVHFDLASNRSFPCAGVGICTACGPDMGNRKKGFLAACTEDCRLMFVMECTAGALDQLMPLYEKRGTLRGLFVRLARAKNKHGQPVRNGKVIATVEKERESRLLPSSFDVAPHVVRSWGYDDQAVKEFLALLPPPETRMKSPEQLAKIIEQLEGK